MVCVSNSPLTTHHSPLCKLHQLYQPPFQRDDIILVVYLTRPPPPASIAMFFTSIYEAFISLGAITDCYQLNRELVLQPRPNWPPFLNPYGPFSRAFATASVQNSDRAVRDFASKVQIIAMSDLGSAVSPFLMSLSVLSSVQICKLDKQHSFMLSRELTAPTLKHSYH